jgi:hypothetical protein
VADADELADVLAPRLEGVPDAVGVERALDGIARLCGAPLAPELAPLVPRARRRGAEDPCARALLAWAGDPVPPLATAPLWDAGRHHRCFELRRADEVARRAAARRPAARLALPTDTTGRVDPAVLDARYAAAGEVDPVDLQQAELRAGRGPADPPLHVALEPVGRWGHLLLHVRPERDPGPVDGPPAAWLPGLAGGWAPPLNPELDPLGAERLTLLWPDGHEWRASAGLRLVAGGEFAAEHAMPLLRVLQVEGRPVGPIAALLIARALNSPRPAVAALATDAAEVALGDGRLAPRRLGDAFGRLLAHGLDGELRWPARLAPLPGAAPALARALAMVPDPPPRAVHKLLEPLDELAQPLREGRGTCERLARGSTRTARLARSLLSR